MKKILFLLPLILALLVSGTVDAKKKKYPNGDYYEGEWKKGQPNGFGKMVYANGDVYEGNWVFGKIEGEGQMIYKNRDNYNGFWKNGEQHGEGCMIYHNGDRYDGNWNMGKIEGMGKFTYKNGDIYNGNWKLGGEEGQGEITYANGDIYKGSWKNKRPEGQGKMTFKNGDVYEGNWVFGKQSKMGKMRFANGNVYEGNWSMGYFEGPGKFTMQNGAVAEGIWHGPAQLKGSLIEKNGTWYKGEWRNRHFYNGKCSGNIEDSFYFNGEIKNGSYFNGKGKGTTNENYYDGEWVNGRFIGTCELNGSKGKPRFSGKSLQDGSMNGTVWFGDTLIYKGTLSAKFIPLGTGTLNITSKKVTCNIDGVWDNGSLKSLNKGDVLVNNQAFSLTLDNDKLILDETNISTYFNKIGDSLKDFIDYYTYIEENELQQQQLFYKKYLKGKTYICQMPLEKYMPKVAGFLDLHSLDVLAIISFKNAFLLRENRLVVINRERLKSNNRGYLIQQNSFMKSFLKDEVHKYEIKDGYLYFNDTKYKFLNDNTFLKNEDEVTLKMYSEKQSLKIIEDFLGRDEVGAF